VSSTAPTREVHIVKGGLLVSGTASDAGKSFVVAGLCRLLARKGVKVAPFKAQNMALNAAVTPDGSEIGHAQWVQALAAGATPEAAMNPLLLKPTGERTSQLIVMGKPAGVLSTTDYHETKDDLVLTVLDALADLRTRYDVVICEGAGSPAEINLLEHDIVNLPLADAADLPAIIVGDIDRGGVFAALYGTVALLPRTRWPSTGPTPSPSGRATARCSTWPPSASRGCPTPATSTRCGSNRTCGCGG
jgi:adenosylcobyric acid synthase